MKKLWVWLKESNRHKHLIGGCVIGVLANSLYCAALAGVGIASAMEYKDRAWGGKFDWVDIGVTCLGTALGFLIRCAL